MIRLSFLTLLSAILKALYLTFPLISSLEIFFEKFPAEHAEYFVNNVKGRAYTFI